MSLDEAYLQKLMRTLSHDMGGTLRTAVGFSTLLLENCGEQFDEKAKNWLQLIKSQGEKTQEQLVALSRYARLYGIDDIKQTCDLAALCAKAINLSSLRTLYPDFLIEIDNLPQVLGYERLWVDYFAEIIVNSARYTGGAAGTLCRVYTEVQGDTLRLMIEDNGVGMTDKQMAMACLPFRAVEAGAPSGVGIGLSIAKRILELHDGRLILQASTHHRYGLCVVAELPLTIVSKA
ncbi:MAG: HAMP domain-containing histidine kinase [Cellvibrionaceae bacterium]|nr:HAMP domain-containing histidine kinase [Cellvibrionaceae bacterium]